MKPVVEIRRHTPQSPWTYSMLDLRQREIAAQIRDGEGAGGLLLSEVAPVITRGRRTAASDLLMPPALLANQGVDLCEVDRGGLATYHGPGQWVLFAVDRLDRLNGDPHGVRKAVEGLLEVARKVGEEFGVQAEIRSGMELGVWSPQGKFAAVGVHVEQRVLLHGLSVNGFKTPQSFLGLRPCGLDAPLDFLLDQPGKSAAQFETLGRALVEAALETFWLS